MTKETRTFLWGVILIVCGVSTLFEPYFLFKYGQFINTFWNWFLVVSGGYCVISGLRKIEKVIF